MLELIPGAFDYLTAGMGAAVCVGIKTSLVRSVAGDLGIERNRDFYERLRVFDGEATRIMNKKKKGTETDEEWQASMEALKGKYGTE